MIGVDDGGSCFGYVFLVDDGDLAEEEVGGVCAVGFDGEVGCHDFNLLYGMINAIITHSITSSYILHHI